MIPLDLDGIGSAAMALGELAPANVIMELVRRARELQAFERESAECHALLDAVTDPADALPDATLLAKLQLYLESVDSLDSGNT